MVGRRGIHGVRKEAEGQGAVAAGDAQLVGRVDGLDVERAGSRVPDEPQFGVCPEVGAEQVRDLGHHQGWSDQRVAGWISSSSAYTS